MKKKAVSTQELNSTFSEIRKSLSDLRDLLADFPNSNKILSVMEDAAKKEIQKQVVVTSSKRDSMSNNIKKIAEDIKAEQVKKEIQLIVNDFKNLQWKSLSDRFEKIREYYVNSDLTSYGFNFDEWLKQGLLPSSVTLQQDELFAIFNAISILIEKKQLPHWVN